ncbi:MAG: GNAT family N-acetyltransferase [Chloroflexi bacterium]|nr:GNAT family N-acetyltransferase [Chloroflexota bacterium]MCL5273759.1 GNAT family N-acetyltransferase [Chloroflexota bacterium]
MTVEIRELTAYEDFKSAEQLQAVGLGFDPLDIVPYALLQSFATSGGAVVGAFSGARMIGVVMGYPGLLADGTPYHRSQRMAVLSAYRGQGIGEALKRKQADVARRYKLSLMCWTYDPLRSINANLNIHKLGATSRLYMRRYYAASTSERDAGASIDRLWVEWDLDKPLYDNHPVWNDDTITVVRDDAGWPSQPDLSVQTVDMAIQIPDDIDAIRLEKPERLAAWRDATSAAFTYYFTRGYRVVDYARNRGYLLSHDGS